MALSIILYGGALFASPILAGFYNEPLLERFIPIMGGHILLTAFGRQFFVREQKALHFRLIAITEIFATVLSFLLAVVLALLGYRIWALVSSELLRVCIINLTFLTRGLRKRQLLLQFSWNEAKPFLRMGVFSLGGQLFNVLKKEIKICQFRKRTLFYIVMTNLKSSQWF